MDYRISVIMPALNEESNIERAIDDVVRSFRALGIPGEIVVVNDGSTDRTPEILRNLTQSIPFIQIINHERPHGIGASFWDGVSHANGEIVTMIPGDAENFSFEILRYVPLMDHVDIVVPFIFNPAKRPWKRRLLSKTYKAIINLSFGILLNYMNGTVMFNIRVLQNLDLKSMGFFYQTELLIKSINLGYLYAEVPSAMLGRNDGRSKALTLGSLWSVMLSYISTLIAVYCSAPKQQEFAMGTKTESRHRALSENSTADATKASD